MFETLNETATKKKKEIKKKIEDIEQELPDVGKVWIEKEINQSEFLNTIAGVDGSSNYREFLSLVIYALGAECVILNGKNSSVIRATDIDILQPYRYTVDRIRFYMTIFELKVGLNALENNEIDYIIFDGSIYGNLIRPVPFGVRLKPKIRTELISNFVPKLEKKLSAGKIEITTLDLMDELRNKFQEDLIQAVVYLEYMENLITLSNLLKYKEKIISISKTSKRNEYFGLDVPDIAIFNLFNRVQGRSTSKTISITQQVKRKFPIRDNVFRALNFKIYYARLEERKNALKFEIPYNISDENFEKILSYIKNYCVDGYPFQLKKAHKDIIITRHNIDLLIKQYGLTERTGREML